MRRIPQIVGAIPLVGTLAKAVAAMVRSPFFRGSIDYWEKRYTKGGTSGSGSFGESARFKAEVLNDFVKKHQIQSIIEFGCGDGNQLALADYPDYIGLDVSKAAVELCKKRFESDPKKSFFLYDSACFMDRRGLFRAELALSLDVIYHLVENEVFELYMTHLFAEANRFVVIFSTDTDTKPWYQSPHVRHRRFSEWIAVHFPQWTLINRIPNRLKTTSHPDAKLAADFFIYQKS